MFIKDNRYEMEVELNGYFGFDEFDADKIPFDGVYLMWGELTKAEADEIVELRKLIIGLLDRGKALYDRVKTRIYPIE